MDCLAPALFLHSSEKIQDGWVKPAASLRGSISKTLPWTWAIGTSTADTAGHLTGLMKAIPGVFKNGFDTQLGPWPKADAPLKNAILLTWGAFGQQRSYFAGSRAILPMKGYCACSIISKQKKLTLVVSVPDGQSGLNKCLTGHYPSTMDNKWNTNTSYQTGELTLHRGSFPHFPGSIKSKKLVSSAGLVAMMFVIAICLFYPGLWKHPIKGENRHFETRKTGRRKSIPS